MTCRIHAAALGYWSAQGAQTLEAALRGTAFLTDPRAFRDGNAGSIIGGSYIAIPSSSLGNHGFWWSQNDGSGTQVGYNPALTDPLLAGYTMHQVSLGSGILTAQDVAVATAPILDAVYDTVSLQGSGVIRITDRIDAASSFTGTDFDSRGDAGIWGTTLETGLPNNFPQADSIFSNLIAPAIDNNYITAIAIFIGSAYAERLRLTICQGGVSSSDMTGAAILFSQQLPPVVSTEGWATIFLPSLIAIGNAANLFVGVVGGASTTNVRYIQLAGNIGDFPSQNLINADVPLGNNPSVAPPATVPAGSVLTGSAFVIGMRVMYAQTPFTANASFRRIWGVHAPAANMLGTSAFNGNIAEGGEPPLQADSLELDYVEVACVDNPGFRVGVHQGASIERPNGAALLWDGGRLSQTGGQPSAYYRSTAPAGILVDRTSPIWVHFRGNGGQTVRFSFGAGGGSAGPADNPMDWPANTSQPAVPTIGNRPEYETPPANPNTTNDPDTPFEATYPNGTLGVGPPDDFLPGNVPGARIGLRQRALTLTQI